MYKQKFGKYILTLLKIILLLPLAFIIQFPAGSEFLYSNETKYNINLVNHLVVLIFGILIAFFSVFYVYRKVNGAAIRLFSFKLKWIIFTIIVIIGALLIEILINLLSKNSAATTNYLISISIGFPLQPFFLIENVIVGPILEEFLFRGILQNGILKDTPAWIKIPITAFLFAFMHEGIINWKLMEWFTLGLGLGYIYYKSNDLKMSIFGHMLSNALIIIIDIC
ncbi:CPBP family intramembrane glutamic endopeptidase [Lactobacillus sp. ESL0703]|uniref:CPBP family intramembrane glutamic endopeptidase n=1 Tax=Lactobacillus sp. ESL0703 TaxID=2983218 RepID=UPI0023F89876|nr:CPBP family intramembrane glutamic endopeptidase [Lactobacillus sp. ESL0703]MDF7669293.1 CPBP family intramembrane metalloprotease [Lactobacillus sp. ESL0703]